MVKGSPTGYIVDIEFISVADYLWCSLVAKSNENVNGIIFLSIIYDTLYSKVFECIIT